MLIHTATQPLGPVDCAELTRQVLSLDEREWVADRARQLEHEVHAQTQSIVLVSCDGWPEISISHGSGWSLLSAYATPVMNDIIARHYAPGGTIIRSMVVRLPGGARIARHRDSHPSFGVAHRIHVPLTTNSTVEFIVNGERVPPRPHFAFELNNHMLHQVTNRGTEHRIHLIFDYLPGSPSKAQS